MSEGGSSRRCRSRSAVASALVAAAALAPATAAAGDRAVLGIGATQLPQVSAASSEAAGGAGGPNAVQRQYNAARDLQVALTAALPASPGCTPLADALGDYARAQVVQAEGVDRLRPAQTTRAGRAGTRALARIRLVRGGCVAQPAEAPAAAGRRIDDPASYEAFFGAVRARAPRAAVTATVSFRGAEVARTAIENGWLRTRISASPARGRLVVTFLSGGGAIVGRATSKAVWLLPQSAAVAAGGMARDRSAEAALTRVIATFRGIASIYSADLVTGTQAGSNDTARFPAASSVKLAVLTAALKRFGPRPEEDAAFYDLQALTAWSSNLAANRLLAKLGGPAIAQAELLRLGARASTYPGTYIVGTAFTREPPRVSSRVTTARDLGVALATLQRAALGQPRARASSGLTVHEARVALGLLLSAEAGGDTIGVLRPALGRALPIAQKQGWLDDVRITAAIVYTPRGPRIVVVCAYAQDLALGTATAFGRRVVSALRLR